MRKREREVKVVNYKYIADNVRERVRVKKSLEGERRRRDIESE